MKTSETLSKIAPALLAAQREIGNASKNATNPHYKNTYANLGAVIDAVKAALNKNGIGFIQTLSPGDGLHLTTRLIHESGEWIEDTAYTPLPKQDPQGVGSATTYLRRYSLAAICGITQEDDDGEGARQPSKPAPITKDQLSTLGAYSLDAEKNARVSKALKLFGAASIEQLSSEQAEQIINKLK